MLNPFSDASGEKGVGPQTARCPMELLASETRTATQNCPSDAPAALGVLGHIVSPAGWHLQTHRGYILSL